MTETKKIIVIAGPNGAGKTTIAKEYLPRVAAGQPFINADHIAADLVPDNPESAAVRAARIMLQTLDALAAAGESFVFETTLSGRGYAKKIRRWRTLGYFVELHFLSLKSPEDAIDRVAKRVLLGGHNIPPDVIRRRFHAGLDNFHKIYRHYVDFWSLYDNNGDQTIVLQSGENPAGEPMRIAEKPPPAYSDNMPETMGERHRIALDALHRAAKRAHFIAYQHGEGVVVNQNGKPVTIPPDPKMYGELLAEHEREQKRIAKKRAALQAEFEKNGPIVSK